MAVVINEFEVVPEPQSTYPAAGATSSGPQASQGLTAHGIELIILKMAERYARIRAH